MKFFFAIIFLLCTYILEAQESVLNANGGKVIMNFLSTNGGTISGTIAVGQNATITGTLDVKGNTTLTGTTTLNGKLTTNAGINNTGTIVNTGKIVVGASSAASSSAVLEASSTTQGFLPPRMTYVQRDAITSPIQALMIYCTDCGSKGEPQYYNGTEWVNLIGGSAQTPAPTIGMSYQGGIIFYILQSGDKGYTITATHGLIAAKVDQSTGIRWNNGGSFFQVGGIENGIGTGLANTNAIILAQGETKTSYAAGLARAYNGGGYTDWYLPSIDELNQLYISRSYFVGSSSFSDNIYWSSSQWGDWAGLIQGLTGGGGQNQRSKDDPTASVRAIRSF